MGKAVFPLTISDQSANVKKGITIEVICTSWVVVEAVVAMVAGFKANSLALVVYGMDSVI
jgi:hypothetical protein